MAIISFDGYPQNLEAYGGRSCFKLGINYNGERYMIKFPANLKDRQLKNVERSYSNSPVSEYIGSHIYEALGIPVHETVLGIRDKKVVVGCKDIRKKQEEQQIEKEHSGKSVLFLQNRKESFYVIRRRDSCHTEKN